jgi:hypothetical protein
MAKREHIGFIDKLYWRPVGEAFVFHCFSKTKGNHQGDRTLEFTSLCGHRHRTSSGGQACARPPTELRCGRCDVAEINRREADESMPESPDWRERHGW